MSTQEYHLDPGNSLSDFGVYTTALLQAIKLALPNDYHGGVIFAETTPPVVGQPTGYATDWYAWHKRCVWLVPSTGAMYVYKSGTGWVSIFSAIPANTITTAMLQDHAVTLAKLSVSGGAIGNTIRVNAAGNGFEFVDPNTMITALPVGSIAGGAVGAFQFLRSSSGAVAWQDFDSAFLLTIFGNNEIPLNYLAWGGANKVVSMNSAGTGLEWASVISKITDGTLPVAKLAPETGNALKSVRVNAAGNAFEFYTPATATTPSIETKTDEIASLPAAGSSTNKAHTLGGFPTTVLGGIVCVTADSGYQVYDMLDIGAVKYNSGSGSADFSEVYQYNFDSTNVTLTCVSSGASKLIANKTTGAVGTFTPGNWKFRFTAVRYY